VKTFGAIGLVAVGVAWALCLPACSLLFEKTPGQSAKSRDAGDDLEATGDADAPLPRADAGPLARPELLYDFKAITDFPVENQGSLGTSAPVLRRDSLTTVANGGMVCTGTERCAYTDNEDTLFQECLQAGTLSIVGILKSSMTQPSTPADIQNEIFRLSDGANAIVRAGLARHSSGGELHRYYQAKLLAENSTSVLIASEASHHDAPADTPQHLALVVDEIEATIYLDGIEQSGAGATVPDLNLNGSLWRLKIGDDVDGRYWAGTMNALAFYCRALNATEVLDLYDQGVVGAPND
jgi:hypothetical protein